VSDVVIGEAVVVEVRVAQLPTRGLALLIDGILQGLAITGLGWVWSQVGNVTEEALAVAIAILTVALVLVGYPVICETLSRGRSVGKLVFGLRVVSDDGGPERFRQALFRGLAGVVEFWLFLGAPALISSLISPQGKRLGDLFSGTIVISERGPRQAPPPQMPPQLARWAATLELSRLPEGIAATARQYLSRWHQLAPAVRHEMGMRIAAEFASYVSPPPPPNAPPYAYLAAVLAERRHRTEARLARQMARSHHTWEQQYGRTPGQQYGWTAEQQYGRIPQQQYDRTPGQQYGRTPGQQYDPPVTPYPAQWQRALSGPLPRPMSAPPPVGAAVPLPPPVVTPQPGGSPGGFTAPF
jgi:uncharacterized RDD family membrane protein YckC